MQIISLHSTPTSVPNPWKIRVALFYSLKPCPNQLSLKDSVRHSEKFLSMFPSRRNRTFVAFTEQNYSNVAAPAVAAADLCDEYVNDINAEDDSGDNECVFS